MFGVRAHRPRLAPDSWPAADAELMAIGLDAAKTQRVASLLDGTHTNEGLVGELLSLGLDLQDILSIFQWFEDSSLIKDDPSSQLTRFELAERKHLQDQIR